MGADLVWKPLVPRPQILDPREREQEPRGRGRSVIRRPEVPGTHGGCLIWTLWSPAPRPWSGVSLVGPGTWREKVRVQGRWGGPSGFWLAARLGAGPARGWLRGVRRGPPASAHSRTLAGQGTSRIPGSP